MSILAVVVQPDRRSVGELHTTRALNLHEKQVDGIGQVDELLATAARHGVVARGLLLEPMADAGVELIVGIERDPSFGPCVIVGLGGVFTEVLDDVALRLAPVTQAVAMAMIDELRGARLLDGARGGPPVDKEAVAGLIVDLSRLAVDRGDLFEVDLNPVIASADGAVAVDGLVVLAGPPLGSVAHG